MADYPFTTLQPHLGVVSVEAHRSFVIADIPGLIEGAADGAGLGIQFLRHLQRTRILLHLVDLMPLDDSDPAEQVRAIEHELGKYDRALLQKPRWLVMNKTDLLLPDEARERAEAVVAALDWKEPWFTVSAIGREGTREVCLKIQQFFDKQKYKAMQDAADLEARSQAMRDKAPPVTVTIENAANGSAAHDAS